MGVKLCKDLGIHVSKDVYPYEFGHMWTMYEEIGDQKREREEDRLLIFNRWFHSKTRCEEFPA
jgi:hypothetical protein